MNVLQYLRSKLFDAFAILWTALLSPSLPILWLLGSSSHYIRLVSQFWVSGLLFGLDHIVRLRYIERGRRNIPNEACIIIANHQSTFETLVLSHLFPNASFVSKKENARIPAVGWYLKNYPMIMINRNAGNDSIQKIIQEARPILAEGRPIIFFPEGTRKNIHTPIIFKQGIKTAYRILNRPVLPIALNSGVYWPPSKKYRRKTKGPYLTIIGSYLSIITSYLTNYVCSGTVIISYLPPIMPGLSEIEFTQQAQSVLQQTKEKLVSEAKENKSASTRNI